MAQYYYNKYNVSQGDYEEIWVSQSVSVSVTSSGGTCYPEYQFNSSNGKFNTSGYPTSLQSVYDGSNQGTFYYNHNNNYLIRFNKSHVSFKGQSGSLTISGAHQSTSSRKQTRGTLVQSNIIAANGTYPANGVHTDGYWYIRGSLVPTNRPPTTPGIFTSPSGVLEGGSTITVTWGASTDPDGDTITYYPQYQYYKNGSGQGWQTLINNSTSRSRTLELSNDGDITGIQFRVRARDGQAYSSYRTSSVFEIEQNTAPTINLSTTDNQTLYENDTLNISGYAKDDDSGDIVSVRYRINNGTSKALASGVSDGNNQINFNKNLTFKGGSLFDGSNELLSNMLEGQNYTLEVWATDDDGGESVRETRTFYVVPNRPPKLTINSIDDKSSLIGKDVITVSGDANDPDGNNITVEYNLNNSNYVEIYYGPDSNWEFNLKVEDLRDGENSVRVRVTDSYNASTVKEIKLNRFGEMYPLLKSIQRYRINAPDGLAKGLLLWVKRQEGLSVKAHISMTDENEFEDYQEMTLDNSVAITDMTIEDEFIYEAVSEKEKIMLKLEIERESTDVNPAITLITGVLS